MEAHFRAGSRNLSTGGIWGQVILCCGDCPMHCRAFSSIPDLHPLHARSVPPLPNRDIHKTSPGTTRCTPGCQNHPHHPWLRTTPLEHLGPVTKWLWHFIFLSLLTLCVKCFARVASLTAGTNKPSFNQNLLCASHWLNSCFKYTFRLHSHLIHRVSHYSHFIDGESKVQRGLWLAQRHTDKKWWSLDLNPDVSDYSNHFAWLSLWRQGC